MRKRPEAAAFVATGALERVPPRIAIILQLAFASKLLFGQACADANKTLALTFWLPPRCRGPFLKASFR